MDKIYFNQLSGAQPMAEGVKEAMESWGSVDGEALVRETREQISTLFKGPGAENVIFTESVGTALEGTIKGLFSEGIICLFPLWRGMTLSRCWNLSAMRPAAAKRAV